MILMRGRYDAMEPAAQASARRHLTVDTLLVLFLIGMIYIGVTGMPEAFYFWVPILAVALWVRVKQARGRWSL